VYRNFLISLAFATAVCGCGSQVQEVPFQVSDVKPGFCKAVEARPGFFWERPQRVMPCRIENSDRLVFVDPGSLAPRQEAASTPDMILEPVVTVSKAGYRVHSRKLAKPSHPRNPNHHTLTKSSDAGNSNSPLTNASSTRH
jgi:hypothetical protein